MLPAILFGAKGGPELVAPPEFITTVHPEADKLCKKSMSLMPSKAFEDYQTAEEGEQLCVMMQAINHLTLHFRDVYDVQDDHCVDTVIYPYIWKKTGNDVAIVSRNQLKKNAENCLCLGMFFQSKNEELHLLDVSVMPYWYCEKAHKKCSEIPQKLWHVLSSTYSKPSVIIDQMKHALRLEFMSDHFVRNEGDRQKWKRRVEEYEQYIADCSRRKRGSAEVTEKLPSLEEEISVFVYGGDLMRREVCKVRMDFILSQLECHDHDKKRERKFQLMMNDLHDLSFFFRNLYGITDGFSLDMVIDSCIWKKTDGGFQAMLKSQCKSDEKNIFCVGTLCKVKGELRSLLSVAVMPYREFVAIDNKYFKFFVNFKSEISRQRPAILESQIQACIRVGFMFPHFLKKDSAQQA